MGDGIPFSSTVGRIGGRSVLAFSGELDLATIDQFSAAVREQLGEGALLVDLAAVSFMDSSGLRALIELLRESSQLGSSLMIRRSLHPNVRRLLTMTGMLDDIPFEDGDGASDA